MKRRFDPRDYLAANPDVGRSIQEGRERSAWDHFIRAGFREERGGFPDQIRKPIRAIVEAPFRAPPPKVLARAGGAERFALEGRLSALDVYAAAIPVLHMDKPQRILDFGCGYGRLLGFLAEGVPLSTIHATDPDGDALAWCEEAYRDEVRWGRFVFVGNRGMPPLAVPGDYFDLVCAVSVFDGMPERQQLGWLSELRRITKPEGFLIFSGRTVSPEKYFTVLERIPSASDGHHDLVLCMKHPALVI